MIPLLSTVSKPENRFWPNHQNREIAFDQRIKTGCGWYQFIPACMDKSQNLSGITISNLASSLLNCPKPKTHVRNAGNTGTTHTRML